MISNKINTRDKGSKAEKVALNHLLQKGFKLLQKNYQIKGGEIDLIMQDKDFIVFVEVKSVKFESEFTIYDRISRRKKYNLNRTINRWLFENKKSDASWRLDFVGVIEEPSLCRIEHIEFVSLQY